MRLHPAPSSVTLGFCSKSEGTLLNVQKVRLTQLSNWAAVNPKYDSMMSQVRAYAICTHPEQEDVVPGAAVPGGGTKYAPAKSTAANAEAS